MSSMMAAYLPPPPPLFHARLVLSSHSLFPLSSPSHPPLLLTYYSHYPACISHLHSSHLSQAERGGQGHYFSFLSKREFKKRKEKKRQSSSFTPYQFSIKHLANISMGIYIKKCIPVAAWWAQIQTQQRGRKHLVLIMLIIALKLKRRGSFKEDTQEVYFWGHTHCFMTVCYRCLRVDFFLLL